MVVEVNDGGKLETGYYYKDGYCQGFDRRRVESESDGLFLSMRTLNDWHREEYLLAGGTIREASYMRYDQTENPPKGTYEAYEINERQRKKLLRQAYFYLYIAEYIMDSGKKFTLPSAATAISKFSPSSALVLVLGMVGCSAI